MSQYATAEEFSRYGLPIAATSDIAVDDIEECLRDASSIVDGTLRARGYDTPLYSWGKDLVSIVCKLAAYEVLFHQRGANPADPAHSAIVASWQWARDQLRDIAKGLVSLESTGTRPPRGVQGVAVMVADESGTRGW